MKKIEQTCCTIYTHWLMAYGAKHKLVAHPWEAKTSRGADSISFNEVPQHQRDALFACTTDKGFVWKISDMSIEQKPCDGVYYRKSPAYLIMFYPKKFYIISIHNFLHEDKTSKRRSLTEQRASEICILSDSYKMK